MASPLDIKAEVRVLGSFMTVVVVRRLAGTILVLIGRELKIEEAVLLGSGLTEMKLVDGVATEIVAAIAASVVEIVELDTGMLVVLVVVRVVEYMVAVVKRVDVFVSVELSGGNPDATDLVTEEVEAVYTIDDATKSPVVDVPVSD